MITPIEIQNKTFKSGGLGYDKRDVDQFMRELLNGYEALYRENVEQKDKLSVLTEGIQYYKTIEKTLQKALVLAEKTAEDTKEAAIKNAKNIENEAHNKSQMILADAKNELERIHNQTIQLIQQYDLYKAQFKSLAASQMELLLSDSFQINVARLDSFIDTGNSIVKTNAKDNTNANLNIHKIDNPNKNSDIEKTINKDKKSDDFWNNPIKDLQFLSDEKKSEQIDEIIEANSMVNSDHIEGQEEFDFISLEDDE